MTRNKPRPRLGVDHQLLPPLEFLALLVGHVPLPYHVTIRSHGALSTTFRKQAGCIAAPPVIEPPRDAILPAPHPALPATPYPRGSKQVRQEDDDTDATRERRYRWARLIARTWHEDPSHVPVFRGAQSGAARGVHAPSGQGGA